MPPFGNEFFGGKDRLDVDAKSLFGVARALDTIGSGFGDVAEVRAQFAIDGVVEPDWSTPVLDTSEVILLPRVGGG
ncbi:MAG: hypothetical protein KDE55_24445 [Novosphingobium sp.]|nr:hypothetical protein [Novosphingobium sp.]